MQFIWAFFLFFVISCGIHKKEKGLENAPSSPTPVSATPETPMNSDWIFGTFKTSPQLTEESALWKKTAYQTLQIKNDEIQFATFCKFEGQVNTEFSATIRSKIEIDTEHRTFKIIDNLYETATMGDKICHAKTTPGTFSYGKKGNSLLIFTVDLSQQYQYEKF